MSRWRIDDVPMRVTRAALQTRKRKDTTKKTKGMCLGKAFLEGMQALVWRACFWLVVFSYFPPRVTCFLRRVEFPITAFDYGSR